MTLTTNAVAGSATESSAPAVDDKGFGDFLSGILPTVAGGLASTVGIDPRIAGQTVSQVMQIFGIGGPGKDFAPAGAKEQALTELRGIITPHLGDPAFRQALEAWLKAAVEPVKAHKEGKAYQPGDLGKSWVTDAFDAVSDAVSSVDWGQVAQVGMRALPFVLAAL